MRKRFALGNGSGSAEGCQAHGAVTPDAKVSWSAEEDLEPPVSNPVA